MRIRTWPFSNSVRAMLVALILMTGSVGLGTRSPVSAAPNVVVRVTIERVQSIDDTDGGGEEDFYAVVTIDDEEFQSSTIDNTEDIRPNWEFSKSVDVLRGSVPVFLQIFDEDGGIRFGDERTDIGPNVGIGLGVTVNLAPCSVSGGVVGDCGVTLNSQGDTAPRSAVEFRIEVDEPPSAPGLHVRCIHSPIWPQSGETVTITAESLDGALAPRIADSIEIWVDNTSSPALSGSGTAATHTAGPFTGETFSYGCRVQDDGLTAWTGWRVVTVGASSSDEAVPVLFTGPRRSRLDIVFIADRDNYANASDPAFLSDVEDVIRNAYYAGSRTEDLFLVNQDKFNFWIALRSGDAEDDCEHEAPEISWADTGAILHTDTSIRDCAPGGMRLFSSISNMFNVVLHESGHRPFGLADEYCCDGGYFQADEFPNLYDEREDCVADAPALGAAASDCREFFETIDGWADFDWYVSDPSTNDLMNADTGVPQRADVRRINWVFDNCASARC